MKRSLDSYMSEISEVDKMSFRFNPPFHRWINKLVTWIPSFKRNLIYAVNDDGVVYIGPERRSGRLDKIMKHTREIVVHHMLGPTELIPQTLDKEIL